MENNPDFYIEQVSTQCLALFSYYIESEKEAIVIDPLRESDGIIKLAESRGAKIKYIFETHFHADFVSGHYELAEKTGATIVFGPTAKASFKFHEAKDNEDFKIGKVTLRVLHTPGHTPESSSYLLLDASGKQYSVFTGDTLFLGEVGRPDLAVKGNEITEQDLAGWLYDSLRNKLMTLNDDVIVYPGHGAGSACGKKIQAGTYCTIGNQKKSNYALQEMSREEFIKILTTGIAKPPAYFFHDVGLNKKGADKMDDVLKKSLVPLKIDDVKKATSEGAWIVDVRPFDDAKSQGRIPGSLNVQLAGTYAINVAILLKPDTKVIVVAPADKEKEAITRLSRVGYDNVIGYLEGGFDAWVAGGNSTESWSHVTPEDFVKTYTEAPLILDVRNRPELESDGAVDGSLCIPLGELHNRVAEVPKDKKVWVHCKLGGRSYMACSLLSHYGVQVVDCKGGMEGLKQAGFQAKSRVEQ